SLGQLIGERGRIPQDLGLHYHGQVLGTLEYLSRKRRLDSRGLSLSACKDTMKGTESHMAPEVVKVEPRGAKADVWSSACMLLHMLTGCQPWTRYYTCRLYLKAGLQKDPVKRASAAVLKEKTSTALKELGGLRSPVRGPYMEPLQITPGPCLDHGDTHEDELVLEEEEKEEEEEEREEEEEEEEEFSPGSKKKFGSEGDDDDNNGDDGNPEAEAGTVGGRAWEQNHRRDSLNHKTQACHVTSTPISDHELHKLERDFYLSSLSQLHPAEMQEQLLSCLSSECYSNWESWDKRDSGRWSITPGDDLSSGVFSYNSQADGQVFSMDWLGHIQIPPPCCFEGVDVSIQDFNRCIRIRETRRVKVGHIATGISDQISERVFTLEMEGGGVVAHDDEVLECGLQLRCVAAPDFSPAWKW
ncbi:hypothetical protein CRUP_028641, partial [Coryphaenoides rupestris]